MPDDVEWETEVQRATQYNKAFDAAMCASCKDLFYRFRLMQDGHPACIARVSALGPVSVEAAIEDANKTLRMIDKRDNARRN